MNKRIGIMTLFLFLTMHFYNTYCHAITYIISSNPTGAKIYRGKTQDSLIYYTTTPFHRTTGGSEYWSDNYFEARKPGFQSNIKFYPLFQYSDDSQVVVLHFDLIDIFTEYKKKNTIEGYIEYLNTYPKKSNRDEVVSLIFNLICEKENKLELYKDFLDKYPDAKDFLDKYPDTPNRDTVLSLMAKLMSETENKAELFKDFAKKYPDGVKYLPGNYSLYLLGPEKLKIYTIAQFLKKGFSEDIIIPKISRAKSGYKDFELEEMEILINMGFSNKLINAMINKTVSLEKEQKKNNKQQEEITRMKEENNNLEKQNNYNQQRPAQQQKDEDDMLDNIGEGLQRTFENKVVDEVGKMFGF